MSYEIFRAGTRTDANGNTVTITHADTFFISSGFNQIRKAFIDLVKVRRQYSVFGFRPLTQP